MPVLKINLNLCIVDEVRYLDVVDDQVVGVKTLVLCVALGVLEQMQQELCRLLGPATLRGAVHLGLLIKETKFH